MDGEAEMQTYGQMYMIRETGLEQGYVFPSSQQINSAGTSSKNGKQHMKITIIFLLQSGWLFVIVCHMFYPKVFWRLNFVEENFKNFKY